jgi:cytochrome b involved in lipid metabolism
MNSNRTRIGVQRRRSFSRLSQSAMKEVYQKQCDQVSLAETASIGSSTVGEVDVIRHDSSVDYKTTCDACPCCRDVCDNPECLSCDEKTRYLPCPPCKGREQGYYTMCQVRRHNNKDSAWLVAGDTIYDATSYMQQDSHPGGAASILRKAGGVQDCLQDLQFHSKAGVRTWKKYEIGKLRPCEGRDDRCLEKHWWMFWAQ